MMLPSSANESQSSRPPTRARQERVQRSAHALWPPYRPVYEETRSSCISAGRRPALVYGATNVLPGELHLGLASVRAADETVMRWSRHRRHGQRFSPVILSLALLLAILVSAVITWKLAKSTRAAADGATRASVAVLRFDSESAPDKHDPLPFALSDEIANYLSSIHSIAVRPVSASSRYSTSDLQRATNDLKVRYVIAGHYSVRGSQLELRLEVVEGSDNRVIWSDTVWGEPNNMLEFRDRLRERLRAGLLPALSVTQSETAVNMTTNSAAYDLYLRSFAFSHDGEPNLEAIEMLQRAVAMDPTFSSAWEKLGQRENFEYVYAHGGSPAYERAQRAYERAFQLDSNLVSAAAGLILMQAENGDLNSARERAQALVRSRADSAEAHFALSYVLRYGGALRESAAECEAARDIDPADYTIRTCAQTFIRMGDYERAMSYIRLDAGSDWAEGMTLQVLIRKGDREAALRLRPISGMAAPLVRACLEGRRKSEILALSQAEENFPVSDPEPRYHVAVVDAFCGLYESASRLLIAAAQRNYCPAEDLVADPILARMKNSEQFNAVEEEAVRCRKRFALGTR